MTHSKDSLPSAASPRESGLSSSFFFNRIKYIIEFALGILYDDKGSVGVAAFHLYGYHAHIVLEIMAEYGKPLVGI